MDIPNRFNQTKVILDKSKILESDIVLVSQKILEALKKGGKIIVMGHGGSAADAQHIAAEFIGRFEIERDSYPAIAFTTDSSILTSLSNDYSYDTTFSRQCESLVSSGDVVIGITTSGNSKNVIEGIKAAKQKGAITIGLLGNEGGILKELTDISIIVNSSVTSEIQEVHRVIYHIICRIVERELAKK